METIFLQGICDVLDRMGEHILAERLKYLASDEDLDPGEFSATLESARGFLEFYASVESEGKVGLACSPEGWLCAEWRFPDERSASLWFLDADRVMFSATKKNSEFVAIEGRGKAVERSALMLALVQEELFVWRPSNQEVEFYSPNIMWPGIAGPAEL